MDAQYWLDLVRPFVAGRKLIMTGAPLAAYTGLVSTLRKLGADSLFLVANGEGTGDLPSPDDAKWVTLDIRAANVMEELRSTRRLLEKPAAHLMEALDTWDPERQAVVLGTPFIVTARLLGRRVWGGRRPGWEEIEDKVLVDSIWDGAGVTRVPSQVVPADENAIEAACRQLDRGMGAAIAGDASEGFNGGAEYFRWVRTSEQIDEAAAFYRSHCRRVRIMPFLEGIPCSIHGMVFQDRTIAFRPCELVMLRSPQAIKLRYGGAATFWDPPQADREAMRATAIEVGEHLRDRVDYRGALTIDGIMTEDGFRPTELNTRAGAAMGLVTGAVDDLPIGLIQRALVEKEEADFRAAELEELVVGAADQKRAGGGWAILSTPTENTQKTHLIWEGSELEPVEEEPEEPAGTLMFGPSAVGGFLRFNADPDRTAKGPSVAPLVLEAFAAADRYWGTDIGPLEPPRPVP